jgi:predicted MFS family arabinose efflux permease
MVALWLMEMPPARPAATGTLAESLRTGLEHVRRDPVLSRLTLLGAVGSLLAFPLVTYLPVIAGDVLKTGAAGYSLLLSSFGAGAIVGAITTAHRGHVPGRGRALLVALILYGVATAGAVLVRRQEACMALLFAAGWMLVTAFSTLNSLVQENAPEALRGRIVSIYGLAFRGGMPLGSLIAGVLAARFGAPAVIGAYAALLAAFAGVHLATSARLRHL